MGDFLNKYKTKINEHIKTLNNGLDSGGDIISLKEVQQKINEDLEEYFYLKEHIIDRTNDLHFGDVKFMFETISPELFQTNSGRKIINKFINLIKTNEGLTKYYSLCETLNNPQRIKNTEHFLSLLFETYVNETNKQTKRVPQEIIDVLVEGVCYINDIDSMINGFNTPTEIKTLNENIWYLTTKKKTLKNIGEYSNIFEDVKKFVDLKNKVDVETLESDKTSDQLIKDFNEKYKSLEPDTAEAIRVYTSSKDTREAIEALKALCLRKIDAEFDAMAVEELDDENRELLPQLKKKISELGVEGGLGLNVQLERLLNTIAKIDKCELSCDGE